MHVFALALTSSLSVTIMRRAAIEQGPAETPMLASKRSSFSVDASDRRH